MAREQLARFLEAAATSRPEMHAFFMTLARTGLRLGEAFALRWEDVDLAAREIHVTRALSAGEITTPKSGKGRTVDMSLALCDVLWQHWTKRQPAAFAVGQATDGLVFVTRGGGPLDQSRVGKIFKRMLKVAGLPPHFTPHCLRHTFASLLLQQGESPVYVQRQLGHASIQLTVDTYGKWLPIGNKAAVDKLDDAGPVRMKPVGDLPPPRLVIRRSPELKRE